MKIRNGFVSNSSTSSFFLVVLEELHQKVIKEFTQDEQNFLNGLMSKSTFNGKGIRGFSYITDMGGESHPSIDDGDAFDKYYEAVKKDKENVIVYSIDC